MTAKITKAMAREAANRLAKHLGIEPETFNIFEPGFHSSGWTITSETASYEWTYDASAYLTGLYDGRIFFEPVNHWCLGLYPES